MGKAEQLIRWLDRLHSRIPFFIASIVLLGAMLAAASVVSWQSARDQERLATSYDRTIDVLRAANDVGHSSLEMIRGSRGYLLTGRTAYLEPYTSGRQDFISALDRLETFVNRDPIHQSSTTALRQSAESYAAVLARIVELQRQGRNAEAIALVRREGGRKELIAIDRALSSILTQERSDLAALKQHVAAAHRTQQWFFYVLTFAGMCLLVMASLSVVALRRAAARERIYRAELRRQAETDELTGLANRRELMAALDRAIAGARRDEKPLALALIDIDHFKRVNDTYGHAAGDEVIRKVARKAMAAVRGCDVVGRLGGEEFALVLPGAGVAQAYAICERLRAHIQSEDICLPDGTEINVTISSGIARLFADDTGLALVERADQALYEAKNGGRDQVRLAA